MSDQTKIEWTDSTWNPVTGCTKVSPGCDNCYALTFAERFRGTPGHYFEHGFDVQLRPDKLDQPLRWKKPRRIFVNSMSDLFHQDVPDEYIAKVFSIMALAPQHTFQVLTKRHARMRSLLSSAQWPELLTDCQLFDDEHWPTDLDPEHPLPNVWLGVSVENQQWADIRIPALLDTPAAVRFLSCEPLLGPIDFTRVPGFNRVGLDLSRWWVIVGGESGRRARPMHAEWALSIRDQCAAAGVSFLFKQWGEWAPPPDGTRILYVSKIRNGQTIQTDSGHWMQRVGKREAGRKLDGRTWDEYPERIR